jgi:beta-lactamase regulating signal transducer with metallopeptidase domain
MSPLTLPQAALVLGENAVVALTAKATVVMLAALLLIHLARRASASSRHLIAAASFGVLLLLPPATLLVPARVFTVAAPPASPQLNEAAPIAAAHAPVPSRSDESALAPALRMPGLGLFQAAGALYLLGAAALATILLGGVFRLHRMRDRADVSVAGTRVANAMARDLGLPGGIEVAVSPELAVPMTFGWTHPVVLLPAEAPQWDEAAQARALRHELEHVTRGDWATHLLSRVALALYWPHPFVWVLWRRLRLEAERACDDAVIRSQGQAESYAEQLVSLARRLRDRAAVPALSMATRSNLGQRVDAILDGERRRAPRSRLASLTVGAAALAGVLAIAPFRVMGDTAPAATEATDLDQDDEGDPLDMALLEAAAKGAIPRMQRLLERGADANAAIQGDGSPLIAAARHGRIEAMELLMAKGANVNRGVGGDGSPLIVAAQGGHLEAVRLLLDRGADIDLGVRGDGNALIMAAGAGRLETVLFLLERGASIEKVVPGDENALIHASESGQAEVVRLLLERGANVNARVWAEQGSNGDAGEWRTPLIMARRNGHAEVVRLLLAAGARE